MDTCRALAAELRLTVEEDPLYDPVEVLMMDRGFHTPALIAAELFRQWLSERVSLADGKKEKQVSLAFERLHRPDLKADMLRLKAVSTDSYLNSELL